MFKVSFTILIFIAATEAKACDKPCPEGYICKYQWSADAPLYCARDPNYKKPKNCIEICETDHQTGKKVCDKYCKQKEDQQQFTWR